MSNAVTFDDYRFSRKPLALTRNGKTVPLRNRGLKLLDLLIERRGDLVTHDEIRDALWADRNIDFTRGIHVCVREIRKALEDDAETPRYIETLPRQGYRFIADPVVEPGPASSQNNHSRVTHLALAAGALAFLAVAAVVVKGPARAPFPAADSKSPAMHLSISPAEEAYRKGAHLLQMQTYEGVNNAGAYFAEAIGRDSNFVDAYVGLAEVAIYQSQFDEARAQLERAVAIAPENATAQLHLGRIALWQDWDYETAKEHFRRHIAADPNPAKAYMQLAWIAIIEGNPDEAKRAANSAYSSDPVTTLRRHGYGLAFYMTRDFRTGLQYCSEGAPLANDSSDLDWCAFYSAMKINQPETARPFALKILHSIDAAQSEIEALESAPPAVAIERFLRYWTSHIEGEKDPELRDTIGLAEAWAALGETDKAIIWLERARANSRRMLPLLIRDPIYDDIKDNPRFEAIAASLDDPARAFTPSSSL